MKRIAMSLAILPLFTSCKLYDSLMTNSEMVQVGIGKVIDISADLKAKYDGLKDSYDAGAQTTADKIAAVSGAMSALRGSWDDYKNQADIDGDGKTTTEEWFAWLTGAGIGGGAIAGAVGKARSLTQRNRASDRRKAQIEDAIAALNDRVDAAPRGG